MEPLVAASAGRSLGSWVEHRMTATFGSRATMRRVASMPFISGMWMSIRIRAGLSVSTRPTASRPFLASPANSKPSSLRSTARAARRNGAWSSTTSTDRGLLTVLTGQVWHRGAGPARRVPSGLWCGQPHRLRCVLVAEVDEDGLHPAVDVLLLGEAQLGEDRVGVFLYRPLGDEQGRRDRGVGLALGHLGEDLSFPHGEQRQAR